jgi:hypothetical protein
VRPTLSFTSPERMLNPAAVGRYIAEFSKALSAEVRMLLQEVGELRDERRRLQQCVLERISPVAGTQSFSQGNRGAHGGQVEARRRRRLQPRLDG